MQLYQRFVHVWFFYPDGTKKRWQGALLDVERQAVDSVNTGQAWSDTWTGRLLTTYAESIQMLADFQPGTDIHLIYKDRGRRDTMDDSRLLGKLLNCQPLSISIPELNMYEPDGMGSNSRVAAQLHLTFRFEVFFIDFSEG